MLRIYGYIGRIQTLADIYLESLKTPHVVASQSNEQDLLQNCPYILFAHIKIIMKPKQGSFQHQSSKDPFKEDFCNTLIY